MNAGPSSLEFEPAPLPRRFAAFCYDALLLAALLFSFTLLVLAVRLGEPVPPGTVWFPLCLIGIVTAFYCGFWAQGGQTLGMRAWRIRVLRDDGGKVGWRRAAARFAAAVIALAPAGLGFWWALLDRDRRAWHDRWTGTRVVRIDRTRSGEQPVRAA